MIALLIASAAANPSIAGGLGLAQSTGLPVVGVDLSWHPSTEGPSIYGRLAPQWGMSFVQEELPSGRLKLRGMAAQGPFILRNGIGATTIVELPKQNMDIRIGLEVGGEFVVGADSAPWGPGSVGYAPRALAVGEFVRSAQSESAVGLRMGAGSVPQLVCDPSIGTDCVEWVPGFAGGIYAYVWVGRKVQLELELGRTSWFTVGHRF